MKQNAALSSTTYHATFPKFGSKRGTEYRNIMIPYSLIEIIKWSPKYTTRLTNLYFQWIIALKPLDEPSSYFISYFLGSS